MEAPFQPAGDQPRAIEELSDGVLGGERFQTLLGITGSGKSATIAWTIERVQRPTLVIAPNKALAAQLAEDASGAHGWVRAEVAESIRVSWRAIPFSVT